jgi:AcrR family transcriptional regulator
MPLDQAILAAAIATFVEHGYENTTMDEVAARASTTKRTVYSHFGNKEALFRSALAKAVERFQTEMPKLADLSEPAGELEAFAIGFSDLCTWKGAVRLQRVVMSGAEHFAGLGGMLHRDVIEPAEDAVAEYLRALDEHHGVDPSGQSYRTLAGLFLNLTTGRQRFATLLQARQPLPEHPLHTPAPDADHAAIREAVGIFLRGSGRAGRSR